MSTQSADLWQQRWLVRLVSPALVACCQPGACMAARPGADRVQCAHHLSRGAAGGITQPTWALSAVIARMMRAAGSRPRLYPPVGALAESVALAARGVAQKTHTSFEATAGLPGPCAVSRCGPTAAGQLVEHRVTQHGTQQRPASNGRLAAG